MYHVSTTIQSRIAHVTKCHECDRKPLGSINTEVIPVQSNLLRTYNLSERFIPLHTYLCIIYLKFVPNILKRLSIRNVQNQLRKEYNKNKKIFKENEWKF